MSTPDEIAGEGECLWEFAEGRGVTTTCGVDVDDIVDRIPVIDWKHCCYCGQSIKRGRGAGLDERPDLSHLPTGTRVRLKQDVERFDNFIAAAGLTGRVTTNNATLFGVTMDEPLPGCEYWNNEVQWVLGDDENPLEDLEEVNKGWVRRESNG